MKMLQYMMVGVVIVLLGGSMAYLSRPSLAATPGIISYQGRALVSGAPFTGTGKFKFALVDTAGTTTYWSHDGTNGEPANTIDLTVTNGLYSVLLGDSNITNMTAIPESVFGNTDVRLRIWFDDGTANGNKLLAPDQRIVAVGYALVAKSVDAGAITHTAIADFPKVKAGRSNVQNLASNTESKITWNSTIFEASAFSTMHDPVTNNSRLTAPITGTYSISVNIPFGPQTGGSNRRIKIRKNGTTDIAHTSQLPSASTTWMATTVVEKLSANDYVEVFVFLDGTGGANVDATPAPGPTFSMILVP